MSGIQLAAVDKPLEEGRPAAAAAAAALVAAPVAVHVARSTDSEIEESLRHSGDPAAAGRQHDCSSLAPGRSGRYRSVTPSGTAARSYAVAEVTGYGTASEMEWLLVQGYARMGIQYSLAPCVAAVAQMVEVAGHGSREQGE